MTTTSTMPAQRMKNPALVIPEAMEAVQALIAATRKGGVDEKTLGLVHLRVSQINGCSFCVGLDWKSVKDLGEAEARRRFAVAAWRESPYFSDAERAALALAECVTRLADRPDPVPDEVWDEVARHYDEAELSGLLLWIALANVFNRVNVTIRQPAGSWS
ncbi:MAG: carboxymuconolactone decarboxylase family protein [Acidimicrobiales bacterium]